MANIKIEGITLEVEFDYHKAHRGARDSMGVPLTPDEDAEIEITEVKVCDVDIMPLLSINMLDRIEKEIING